METARSPLAENPPPYSAHVSEDGSFTLGPRRNDDSCSCCSMMDGRAGRIMCVILFTVTILVCVLLILSLSDIQYYQMGLKKSKITGQVYTNRVYFSGRYFTGLFVNFKKFKRDAHLLRFHELRIINKEKFELKVDCSLQYFLRPEDLHLLHDKFDLYYEPVLRKTAAAAIKNRASQYSITDYRLRREMVGAGLGEAASRALGGTCCREDCSVHRCREGCKIYRTCNATEKGLFADAAHFQMLKLDISDQEQRFLQQVLEQELKDTEIFKQNTTLTRKKTEEQSKLIENEAFELAENGEARAALVKEKAKAEAKAIVEDARTSGLSSLYETLNISREEDKKTIDYMRTLRGKKSANLYIGFSYVVAKP